MKEWLSVKVLAQTTRRQHLQREEANEHTRAAADDAVTDSSQNTSGTRFGVHNRRGMRRSYASEYSN